MKNTPPLEIERKYLIAPPDIALLCVQEGVRVLEIEQVYLKKTNGASRRVRKTQESGKTVYTYTEKRRLTNISCVEDEREITFSEYIDRLREADPDKAPICKTRYTIPYGGHLLEIDVYPFFGDRAILEIELASEDEVAEIPPYLTVLRDVSNDTRYKNTNLARYVAERGKKE